MTAKPWMKWYPADWRSDPKLRMCSLAARGLWADMIALMHEAEPYGHLVIAGTAPSPQQVASLVGAAPREVSALIVQLEAANVFSRTDDGTIYSRRMVRDKAKAEQDRKNGKGGGNPTLIGGGNPNDNQPDKPGVNPPDKAQRLEARSQKPEGSNSAQQTPPREPEPSPVVEPGSCAEPDGYSVWELWQDARKANGHSTTADPPAPSAIQMAQRWLDAGADLRLIRQAFDAALGREGKAPPRSLTYCEGMVSEALAVKAGKMPEMPAALRRDSRPVPSADELRAGRERTFRETGVWFDEWGAQPQPTH